MSKKNRVILIELNEINFEFIEKYISKGLLPNFATLFRNHGYSRTTSEDEYKNIEPWIQWVSIHTGLKFSDHKVFRLGDIVDTKFSQIWEVLEKRGYTVAAVSPINAANRVTKSPFFIPDPWTNTPTSGSFFLRVVSKAISQAVNDNAKGKLTPKTVLALLLGVAIYSRYLNIPEYVWYFLKAMRNRYYKVLLLDRFLADLCVTLWLRYKPDFTSIFFNGGAHIQHHYLYNSSVYYGNNQNPEWYIQNRLDPILAIYQLYDRILGKFYALDDEPRLMVATGLHQEPYSTIKYYYRLANHEEFLRLVDIKFMSVQTRMSRDFLVEFSSKTDSHSAEVTLNKILDSNGVPLFKTDNRGTSIFVILSYPFAIERDFCFFVGNKKIENCHNLFTFVAIKNALHNGEGYFIDTGTCQRQKQVFPVETIYTHTLQPFLLPQTPSENI